jgi:hypothetical protein
MAVLSSKARKALPTEKFALPATRQYPVDTRARAANAKARATQQLAKGNLTQAQYAKVNAAANKVLKATASKKSK